MDRNFRDRRKTLQKIEYRSCVTSVTTQDTLLRIVMHLMLNKILEEEPQYVSYAMNLDIQKNTVEWTEGIMEETLEIEEMMEEILEMAEGTMRGTLEITMTVRNKEILSVNFEKNLIRHL